MTVSRIERQFENFLRETEEMRRDLHAGAVLNLRASLLLRHRLLLASDDVFQAFALFKSVLRFRAMEKSAAQTARFMTEAANESEQIFAPMVFFLNGDAETAKDVKRDILRIAKDAASADIGALAEAVRALAKAREFYRESLETLHELRCKTKARHKNGGSFH